ncbi:ensconsin isoform X2 [Coregonus clupeaformis]|nr:ensconsin isoform X2 [Coregonus clupeaformis]
MCDLGFSRSPHQCRLRVKTLKANYVRAKLLRSVDDSQPCSFRYYAEMDAVLGRNCAVDGMGGRCHIGSPEGIGGGLLFGSEGIRGGGRHFGSPDGIVGGRHFGSVDGIGTERHSGSPEGIGGQQSRYLVSEVKEEEDREAEDTDEYDSNGVGINGRPLAVSGGRRHDVFLDHLNVYHEPVGHPLEEDLSSRSPSPPPPPPPKPASTLPPPPDPSPGLSRGTTIPSTQSVEPALKHLADCFQRLVSESRELMMQLEGQRQEQVRWQQELLSQWLEREERRQREAADREDRRERARMEHEVRVLQLLTGLAQNQQRNQTYHSCCHQCSRTGGSGASATTRQDNGAEDRDRTDSETT